MYWLGFFVTFVIIAVALLVYNKKEQALDIVKDLPFAGLMAIIVLFFASVWPLTWSVILLCTVTYVVYKFVLRIFDAKTKKDKPDV